MAQVFHPGDKVTLTIDGEPVEATVTGWKDDRTLILDVSGERVEVNMSEEHRALGPLKPMDS